MATILTHAASSGAKRLHAASPRIIAHGGAFDGTTQHPAPTAETLDATDIGNVTATLNGEVENFNEPGTTAWFEWGTSTAYEFGATTPIDVAPLAAPVPVLLTVVVSGTTTYHYRCVASNANGTAYGADVQFSSDDPTTPTVDTLQPSPLTTTSATLRGTVDVFGSVDAEAFFEFGTTVLYELGTFGTQALTATTGEQTPRYAKAVTSGVTYHYRCVVTTPTAFVQGDDETFTAPVPPAPPAVVTTAATSVLETSATLNGTVLTISDDGALAHFEWGPTTAYENGSTADDFIPLSATPVASSASVVTVAATTYHYRIVATDENGTSYGADMTFTTSTPPDPAPSVTTLAPSPLTDTSATLRASVDVFAVAGATGYFEWGATVAYESGQVGAQAIPATSGAQTLTTTVAVSASTTYHYRFVATHASATTQGADVAFTSDDPPALPTVVTGSATNVAELSATLNGTANANGITGGTAWIEYGLTTSYGTTVGTVALGDPDATVAISANIVTTADTTYHFRAAATTSSGTVYGADAQFTSDPHVDPAPFVITRDPNGVTQTSANLRGLVNVFGVSNAFSYFEWGPTTAYENGQVGLAAVAAISGSQAVTYTVTTLASTTYHYRCVAYHDTALTQGNDVTFTTQSPPPPPVVQTLPATLVDTDSATLNGDVQNFGVDGTFAYFEWGTTAAYEFGQTTHTAVAASMTAQAVSFDVSTLEDGTTYHFRVVAFNPNGTTLGGDVTFTTDDIPAPPTCTTAYPDPSIPESPGPTVSVTLHATVSAGVDGHATTTRFYVRKTSDPVGSETLYTAATVTTSTTDVDITAPATLDADTSHVVYATATNVDGMVNGGSLQFRTFPAVSGGGPPTGSTSGNDAAYLTDTAARLLGSINPNGASNTFASFGYGLTQGPPWTFQTAPVNIGGGSSPVTITGDISGLAYDTEYFFAALATNDNGENFSTAAEVDFYSNTFSAGNDQVTLTFATKDGTGATIQDVPATWTSGYKLVITAANDTGVGTKSYVTFGQPGGNLAIVSRTVLTTGLPVDVTEAVRLVCNWYSTDTSRQPTNNTGTPAGGTARVSPFLTTKWTTTLTPLSPHSLGATFACVGMNLRISGNYLSTSGGIGGPGAQNTGQIDVLFEISTNGTSWTTVDDYTETGVAERKSGDPSWPLYGDAIDLLPSTAYQWRGTVTFHNTKIIPASLQASGSFTTPASGGYGVRTQNTVGGVLQACYSDPRDPNSPLCCDPNDDTQERVFLSNDLATGGSSPYDIEVLGANSTLATSLGLATGTVRVWFESPFPKVYLTGAQGGKLPLTFALNKSRVGDVIGVDGQVAGFTLGGNTTGGGASYEAFWGTTGNFKPIVGVSVVGMTPMDGSIDEPVIGTSTRYGIGWGSTKGSSTNVYVKGCRVNTGMIGGHNVVISNGHFIGLIGLYDCAWSPDPANTLSNGYGQDETFRMNGRCRLDIRRTTFTVGNEHSEYLDSLNSAVSCTENQAFSILEDVTDVPFNGKTNCGGAKGTAFQIDERTNADPTQNALSTGPGSRGLLLLRRMTQHGYLGINSVGGPGDFIFYGFDGTVRMVDCIAAGSGTVRFAGDLGKGTYAHQATGSVPYAGDWFIYRRVEVYNFTSLPDYAGGLTHPNVNTIDISGAMEVDITEFSDPDNAASTANFTIGLNTQSGLGGPLLIGDNGIVTVHPAGYDNTNLETYPGFNSFKKMRWGESGLQGVPTISYNSAQIRKFYDGVTDFDSP